MALWVSREHVATVVLCGCGRDSFTLRDRSPARAKGRKKDRIELTETIQCGPFVAQKQRHTVQRRSTIAFRALMRIPRGRGCVR